MKKIFQMVIMPTLAAVTIATALHTFIPHVSRENMDMLTDHGTNTIFNLMAFLFGFLPLFIYGYATATLEAMKPTTQPQKESAHTYYIGQTFTSINANCHVRIKALKTPIQVIANNNELYFDYI